MPDISHCFSTKQEKESSPALSAESSSFIKSELNGSSIPSPDEQSLDPESIFSEQKIKKKLHKLEKRKYQPSTSKATPVSTQTTGPQKKRLTTILVDAVTALKDIAAAKKSECSESFDEFAVFGNLVAKHLRNLPLQEALQSQLDIENMLIKKRLKQNADPLLEQESAPDDVGSDDDDDESWNEDSVNNKRRKR